MLSGISCVTDDASGVEDGAAHGPDEAPQPRVPALPVGQGQPEVVALHKSNKIGTTNSGVDYIEECINEHGVPVPFTVMDPNDGWVSHGVMANTFLFKNYQAELWTWESNDPDGICMALPRWRGNWGRIIGLICLGRTTSRTCFWDNKTTLWRPKGVPISIFDPDFFGGYDLDGKDGGRCSDCHAGENPFVVHPDDPVFQSAKATVNIEPLAWPSPVVPDVPNWPANKGPLEELGHTGPGEQRCDFCHVKGNAGRFPIPSLALSQYCSVVLQQAVASNGTMPASPYDHFDVMTDYQAHRQWLLQACASSAGSIEPVDPPSEIVLGPPIVQEPLYGCAEYVVVKAALQGARVELYVNSQFVGAVDPFVGLQAEFTLSDPLVANQVVEAVQVMGLEVSDPGSATVRNHLDDFPNPPGLPPPLVTPTPLYECATAIAIQNIPGAELQVIKETPNGWTFHTTKQSVAHTWFGGLGPPFEIGDRFFVRQRICSDTSGESPMAVVEAAPTSLPAPAFDPTKVMVGQPLVTVDQIVQGARVVVEEATAGLLWSAQSVPYNWLAGIDVATPLGSPIQAQHELRVGQAFCGGFSHSPIPPVEPCDIETLGHSIQIAQPQGGDEFVLVTESIPGATILVMDTAQAIGSGSGFVIGLKRPLVSSEVIGVAQKLGSCTSFLGYVTVVL